MSGEVETDATRRGTRCGCCLPALTRLARPSPAPAPRAISSVTASRSRLCWFGRPVASENTLV